MESYYHSVTLDKDKCVGCTNCIKSCPTEAIRVREGKTRIIKERCIDCGECIRICPQHAKLAIADPLSEIQKYRYPIALPAPTLYSQFDRKVSVDKIMAGLLQLGFFRVWEVARAADIVSKMTEAYLAENKMAKPVISASCPAVTRLIRVRFPELLDHIIPLFSPMETAAVLAKKEMAQEGYPTDQVGAFFISPCAAKVTSVKGPLGFTESQVNGVIAISEIYGPLYNAIKNPDSTKLEHLSTSTGTGIGWAVIGGESRLLKGMHHLCVDGMVNVARVLEEVEMGKLKEVDYIEGLSCVGGCVGGPLTVENPFMAKSRIEMLAHDNKTAARSSQVMIACNVQDFTFTKKIQPVDVLKLDEDIFTAMQKMESLETIHKSLPALDCGSCGAPTCRALAEDIVRGQADQIDCVFKLREKVTEMAEQMVELSRKLPPSIANKTNEKAGTKTLNEEKEGDAAS